MIIISRVWGKGENCGYRNIILGLIERGVKQYPIPQRNFHPPGEIHRFGIVAAANPLYPSSHLLQMIFAFQDLQICSTRLSYMV